MMGLSLSKTYTIEVEEEDRVRYHLQKLGVSVESLLEAAAYQFETEEQSSQELILLQMDASDPKEGFVAAPEFGWDTEAWTTVALRVKVTVTNLSVSWSE